MGSKKGIISVLLAVLIVMFLFISGTQQIYAAAPDIIVQYHVWMDTPYGPESTVYPRNLREFRDGIIWGTWDARRSAGQPASYPSPDTVKPDGYRRYASTSGSGYPMLGLYDPDDPEILRWHIRLAKAAGIKAFAVSAYAWDSGKEEGQRTAEILRKMLPIAQQENFYLAWELFYGGSTSNISSYQDIVNHPNFYKINNKPVLWIALQSPGSNTTYWGKEVFGFLEVTGGWESSLATPITWAIVIRHDTTINFGTIPSRSVVSLVRSNIEDESSWDNFIYHNRNVYPNLLLGAHIYPGFDNSIAINTPIIYKSRNSGETLRSSLQHAVSLQFDYIFIESWNDFGEATAIEPGEKEGWNSGSYANDYYKDLRIIAETTGANFTPPPLPPSTSLDPLYRTSGGTISCNPASITLQQGVMGTATVTSTATNLGGGNWAQVCVSTPSQSKTEVATFNTGNNTTQAPWIAPGKTYTFTLYKHTTGTNCAGSVLATCTVTGVLETSPTSIPTTKPGDANGDGRVDGVDYVVWLNNYNQSVSGVSNGDFNSSGKVDGVDYVVWLNNYGKN